MSEPNKDEFFASRCSFISSCNYPASHMEVDLFVPDEILPEHSMNINTVEQTQSFLFPETAYSSVCISGLLFELNQFKFSCLVTNHQLFESGNYIRSCILQPSPECRM